MLQTIWKGQCLNQTSIYWVRTAANKLCLSQNILWNAMTSVWVKNCIQEEEKQRIIDIIEATLNTISAAKY